MMKKIKAILWVCVGLVLLLVSATAMVVSAILSWPVKLLNSLADHTHQLAETIDDKL